MIPMDMAITATPDIAENAETIFLHAVTGKACPNPTFAIVITDQQTHLGREPNCSCRTLPCAKNIKMLLNMTTTCQ